MKATSPSTPKIAGEARPGAFGEATQDPLTRAVARAGISRRDFIRKSAAGATGLALAQVLLPACSPGRPAPEDLRALGPLEFATLATAADRIIDGMNYPGGGDAVALRFDASLAAAPPWIRSLFLDAVRFLEFSPMLLSFPPGRFSTRPAETRDRILMDMAGSALLIRRQVFAAVKQAVLFTAYAQPETWSGVRYDGPGEIFKNTRQSR